jgi:hypothetical protein
MDIEVAFGLIFGIAWAALIIWAVVKIAISGRRSSLASGLFVGATLGSGITLFFKIIFVQLDTMGVGAVLAMIGTAWLWGAANDSDAE